MPGFEKRKTKTADLDKFTLDCTQTRVPKEHKATQGIMPKRPSLTNDSFVKCPQTCNQNIASEAECACELGKYWAFAYTYIYMCWLLAHVSGLFTIKCISVAMTSSLVSAKPWHHVQACASSLCVLSELSTDCWKQSGAARNSSKFAILLRAYFCAKAHWVVLLSTRRSAKFEQLSATHCNSDSYFLYTAWNFHGTLGISATRAIPRIS